MTVLSDQDNSVISGNGGSGNSQSRWVGKSAFVSHFSTHDLKLNHENDTCTKVEIFFAQLNIFYTKNYFFQ